MFFMTSKINVDFLQERPGLDYKVAEIQAAKGDPYNIYNLNSVGGEFKVTW